MTPENQPADYQLSPETIAAMGELGSALATIYQRLKKEGYRLEAGTIIQTHQYENDTNQSIGHHHGD